MRNFIFYLFFACICSSSCSIEKRNEEHDESNSDLANTKDSLRAQKKELTADVAMTNEDFNEFYKLFLQDSAFQVSRLLFPLEGEKIVDDER